MSYPCHLLGICHTACMRFLRKASSELSRILGWRNTVMGILNTIATKIENSLDIKIIEWLDVSFCNFHIHSNSRKNIELELCYCKFNFSLAHYSCVISRDWLCDVFSNFVQHQTKLFFGCFESVTQFLFQDHWYLHVVYLLRILMNSQCKQTIKWFEGIIAVNSIYKNFYNIRTMPLLGYEKKQQIRFIIY